MISSKNNLSTSNPSSYKETWFIVPSYILDLPNITLGFLRVYEAFFQFHNKGLPCFLSNKLLTIQHPYISSNIRIQALFIIFCVLLIAFR